MAFTVTNAMDTTVLGCESRAVPMFGTSVNATVTVNQSYSTAIDLVLFGHPYTGLPPSQSHHAPVGHISQRPGTRRRRCDTEMHMQVRSYEVAPEELEQQQVL
jgi:hypothetical protein